MGRFVVFGGCFAVVVLLAFHQPSHAASGPAPFECPWTAVPSGTTNPSSDGCYGGGDDGCGTDDNEPDIPCEQQQPPLLTTPGAPVDFGPGVTQAINELKAAGTDLTGPNCGKIVELACRYVGGGAGLLSKNYGNQYNGHSVDVLVFPDGSAYDVVSNCGGDNDTGIGGNNPSAGALCCTPDASGTGCTPSSRYMPCP